MTDPKKAKGDAYERAVREHARANGFPWCERTRAGYERDHGDLHLDPVAKGVIVQAKNHNRLALPEWLRGLEQQLADSGAEHGVLVVKRRGVSDPGKSFAVMELDAMLRLLRQAGYGTPLDVEARKLPEWLTSAGDCSSCGMSMAECADPSQPTCCGACEHPRSQSSAGEAA